jgi:hypothetical protein
MKNLAVYVSMLAVAGLCVGTAVWYTSNSHGPHDDAKESFETNSGTTAGPYQIGQGIHDITGPAADVNLMG